MRKRWDNKVVNWDLIREWVDSIEESRNGWGEEVWDGMRIRMKEEIEKMSRVSLVVRNDVEELESCLKGMRFMMEVGMSIGNILGMVISGNFVCRLLIVEGYLE